MILSRHSILAAGLFPQRSRAGMHARIFNRHAHRTRQLFGCELFV